LSKKIGFIKNSFPVFKEKLLVSDLIGTAVFLAPVCIMILVSCGSEKYMYLQKLVQRYFSFISIL